MEDPIGLFMIGPTVGPCEGCPDPGLCMAEDECQVEAMEGDDPYAVTLRRLAGFE